MRTHECLALSDGNDNLDAPATFPGGKRPRADERCNSSEPDNGDGRGVMCAEQGVTPPPPARRPPKMRRDTPQRSSGQASDEEAEQERGYYQREDVDDRIHAVRKAKKRKREREKAAEENAVALGTAASAGGMGPGTAAVLAQMMEMHRQDRMDAEARLEVMREGNNAMVASLAALIAKVVADK